MVSGGQQRAHPADALADAPLDPERRLMLAYVPAPCRPAVLALWALDQTFGAIVSAAREPVVGQMRLTWWHDALCALDGGAVSAHPVLVALAAHVVPAGVSGAEMAGMIEGWEVLLDPAAPGEAAMRLHGAERGARLFQHIGHVLAPEHPATVVQAAGAGWALVDLACHLRQPEDAARAAALAALFLARGASSRWPVALRPLGMLAALARRDATGGRWKTRRQGAPGRLMTMASHRLFGR